MIRATRKYSLDTQLRNCRAGLVSVVLVGTAVAAISATSELLSPQFVARWGGHTKDLGFAIAVEDTSVFVAGATWSADFPVSVGSSPTGAMWCGFLTQLRRSNGALVRSAALCGRGMTYGRAVAGDGRGSVWVGGSSDGPGLPASRNAAQPQYVGGSAGGFGDAFVARWSVHGDINYLTYLGGSGDETVWGATGDGIGGVWVVGSTTSRPLIHDANGDRSTGTLAAPDGFMAHVGASGRLEAVKVLGGNGIDELYDAALVGRDQLIVVGATASSDSVLGRPRGRLDGFVASLDPATLKVSWTLRLGAAGDDVFKGVAVVDERTIAVVGRTDGGACRPRAGNADGWMVTISSAGSVLRNECVGTAAIDSLSDVAVTPDGGIWFTGTTDAASMSKRLPGTATKRSHDRAFVGQVRSQRGALGALRVLSNEISRGYGIAASTDGDVYIVGETTAVPSHVGPWIPTLHPTPGAFRASQRLGSTDPFVVALPKPDQ